MRDHLEAGGPESGGSAGLALLLIVTAGYVDALGKLLAGPDRLEAAANLRLHAGLWGGFVLGAALGTVTTLRWDGWATLPPAALLLATAAWRALKRLG